MNFNFFNRKLNANALFMGHYADAKAFYVMRFNELPCISYMGELDTGKAFEYISNDYSSEVNGIYQHNYFDHEKQQFFFNNTLFVMKNKRMIELGNNFCHVLHTKEQYGFGNNMIKELAAFRVNADANRVIGFARSNNVNAETN